ncbi:MAG: PLP-dependent transferase [Ignavibacteriae bacterium]|nr:PLP-dependent transferase [Ignavibacteriota bacterium]
MKKPTHGLATRAIHGKHMHPFKGPVAPPIVQTSTYRFDDSHDAVRYAQGDPEVYVYTRYHNPTVRTAQEHLAEVMGTEATLLTASGMAAISSAILAVVKAGDTIISTPALYGGTYRFFRDILPRHGITVRYCDPRKLDALRTMITPTTKLVYFESPTNPTLEVVDIPALVAAVRAAQRRTRRNVTIVCDNTFATSMNQRPIELGVDVVVESATKYLGGHSDIIAGVVAGSTKMVADAHFQMKYYGGCADPFAAYLLLRSMKTFALRVERQNASAMELAAWFERHPRVLRTLYPGLRSHPEHAAATRQMVPGAGYGGMVTIEVPGGVRGAVKVCDALRVAVNAMSLGGAETLVSIPVYSSHVGMTAKELKRHCVTPGMVRISVGLEDVVDLKADFDRALRRVS